MRLLYDFRHRYYEAPISAKPLLTSLTDTQVGELCREIHDYSDQLAHLGDDFLGYMLLTALHNHDQEVIGALLTHVDYGTLTSPEAQLAKGRLAARQRKLFPTVEHFYRCFELAPHLMRQDDYVSLIRGLQQLGRLVDVEHVFAYLVRERPEDNVFKALILQHQIKNRRHLKVKNEDIVSNLNYLHKRATTADEYMFLSLACFDAGYYPQFEKASDAALGLVKPPTHFLAEIPKPKKNFTPETGISALTKVLRGLEEADVDHFIAFGTLLGLVREGQLLSHDKDADVGVLVDSPEAAISCAQLLCKGNESLIAPSLVSGHPMANHLNVAVLDCETGIAVDLFFFYQDRDGFYSGVYTTSAPIIWRYSNLDTATEVYAGKQYPVPAPPERFLECTYGSMWREPVVNWDSLINCPNITNESKKGVHYFGAQRLFRSIQLGEEAKAREYWRALRNDWRLEFDQATVQNIEDSLASLGVVQ